MFDRSILALRRKLHHKKHVCQGKRSRRTSVFLRYPMRIICLCAFLLFIMFVSILELRLRPVVEHLVVHQVNNLVTAQVNCSLMSMEEDYENLVDIQRDEAGKIIAVASNMAQVNHLRNHVASQVLDTVSKLDVHELGVPLGSLFDIDLLWAKGPKIRVHSLVVGLVNTQVDSDFYAAGINQTIHRVLLDVEIPLTVLLPGIVLETKVNTSVCVAETVIIGTVPSTYLTLNDTPIQSKE